MMKNFIKRLKSWWRQSIARELFMVKAFQDGNAGGLMTIAILAFCFFIAYGLGVINSVRGPDELEKKTAKIYEAQDKGRSSCGAKIALEIDGAVLSYRAFVYSDKTSRLRDLIGKKVTVWIQPQYELCGRIMRIERLKYADEIIIDYDYEKRKAIKDSRRNERVVLISFLIIVFCLLGIWFYSPKSTREKGVKQ